jgi:hypothetical protein
MKRLITRGLAAAALAGTLGFGAAQALAAPAPAGEAARVCNDRVCNTICEARWGPFASGRCVDGRCECAV